MPRYMYVFQAEISELLKDLIKHCIMFFEMFPCIYKAIRHNKIKIVLKMTTYFNKRVKNVLHNFLQSLKITPTA